ncbi:MAG: AAA family ATPase [Anaerolineales bacterium]|nr:AAA family ATPase [Anaerolineales bacterium]
MTESDLFDHVLEQRIAAEAPLAARMRPRSFDEFVGQQDIVGPGRLLRRAIEADRLFSSILLWGPPGTGKTTLATIIANSTESYFTTLSAVLAGVRELRVVIEAALERRKLHGARTILFVDEVHRWNKAQQDALLPHVERGVIVLISATTENPYFEVISPLMSRSRVFQFRALADHEVLRVLKEAMEDPARGYGGMRTEISQEALRHLVRVAGGDARNALNALELAVESTPPNEHGAIDISLSVAQESIQKRAVLYDRDGDAHYDTISAFIKSVRGSDPDAALYWLAKMLHAGESPRFILRRLLILAGEDIGLADPLGIVVTNAAAQAFEYVGMPEGVYPLVEATLYLSTAPKSNSTRSFFQAQKILEEEGFTDVPMHLKDAHRDGKVLGHGEGYMYPHGQPGHYAGQQYMPTALLGSYFYQPSDQGYEAEVEQRLSRWRTAQRNALGIEQTHQYQILSEEEIIRLKAAKAGK